MAIAVTASKPVPFIKTKPVYTEQGDRVRDYQRLVIKSNIAVLPVGAGKTLLMDEAHMPMPRIKSRYDNTGERNKDICAAYQAGLSYDECAKKFKCSVSSVRHALKTGGVTPRAQHYNHK